MVGKEFVDYKRGEANNGEEQSRYNKGLTIQLAQLTLIAGRSTRQEICPNSQWDQAKYSHRTSSKQTLESIVAARLVSVQWHSLTWSPKDGIRGF